MVIEITDENFEDEVLKSKVLVVVDFWAPWCGPCRIVSPAIEQLSDAYAGKLEFCKLNVDEEPETAQSYGIMSIPTLMLFENGQEVDAIVGAVPESSIKAMIDTLLK